VDKDKEASFREAREKFRRLDLELERRYFNQPFEGPEKRHHDVPYIVVDGETVVLDPVVIEEIVMEGDNVTSTVHNVSQLTEHHIHVYMRQQQAG